MIFYFSATGNSLYVAQKIASSENTKIISIPTAIKQHEFDYIISEHEKIGFVFPTYFFGIPTIISQFILKLNIKAENNACIFLVLTCGGTTGNACEMFYKLLLKKGYLLSSSFAVQMVDNYVLMYHIPNKEEQFKILNNADLVIDDIIRLIDTKQYGWFNFYKGDIPKFITKTVYLVYKYGRGTRNFRVKDNCIHCGLCQNICPDNTITLNNGKPTWKKKKCIHCLACINRCPVSAIEFGNKTINKGRYINPRVKM